MDTKRALEIYNAEETIPVHLDGRPVWIEKVDETSGTAAVKIESNPERTQNVPVDQLQEGFGSTV
ncbi:H-type small acid-soluble spore protein [Paenibacillus humicola]|uniref:H-type small acid-soluble spore protein n=1 Tax=Paenibacillus humicola TaxID=3110540 RepID=UPI00237A7F86|nr:H-type small acid-soluble spore protein [Paenibacillus humicola]